jgi:hypothetical protein
MMKTIDREATSFYELSFASQMIVWAMRKRLHALAGGPDDSHVADVFRLADLDELYAALTSIVDVLVCGPSNRLQLHGVSCPCLASHEISVINTLARLQSDEEGLAYHCLVSFIGAPLARLVWPAIRAIAEDLAARALSVTRIKICPESARTRDPRMHHVVH